MAVAGLVGRQMQSARERHRVRQRRLDLSGLARVEQPMRDAERGQNHGRTAAAVAFVVGLKNLQNAAAVAVVANAGLLPERDETGLAVMGDALHARLVVRE